MAKGVKNKKIEATEAQAVLDNVKDMELTKVVSEIGSLQVSLQGTLANLSATITNKIQQVDQLDTAITLKEQRLQELHGIEKEAVSLDEMKAQKEEEARKWEKERDERNAQWDEEEEERAKMWQRSEDDFKYTTEQEKPGRTLEGRTTTTLMDGAGERLEGQGARVHRSQGTGRWI